MRFMTAALLLVAATAQAQAPMPGKPAAPAMAPSTAPMKPATAAPAPAATAAATTPTTPPAAGARVHRTLQVRFDDANTTHDGHLTLEQARAKMPSVARDFDQIDTDHKGYVTEEQIKAFRAARRAARKAAKQAAAGHK